jgi:uncharacterized delta-60 repeat protein
MSTINRRGVARIWWRVLASALFAATSAGTVAQVPLAPSIPLFMDGSVNAVVTAPDGSFIVGGSFTTVAGQPRRNIARLLADGTLDPNWNPGTDNIVTALAVDNANGVYVGGCFGSIGGKARRGLAKLALDSAAVNAAWKPTSEEACPSAMMHDGAGHLYVGGFFQNINRVNRPYLAKLDANGNGDVDESWNATADMAVSTIAFDSDGNVYAGGYFANIGGAARTNVARLSPTNGSADPNWNPNPTACSVDAIVPDNAGAVYIGGCFVLVGGLFQPSVAKMSSIDATLDTGWNPFVDGAVHAMRIAGGRLYIGGEFHNVGGLVRNGMARLSLIGAGAADPTWNPNLASRYTRAVSGVGVNSLGNSVFGGVFNKAGGQPRRGLAAMSTTGALLPAIDTESPGRVMQIAALPGGGAIVGGDFNRAGNTERNALLRLQPGGALDMSWNPDPNGPINAVVVRDGSIYVGGIFSTIAGEVHVTIAKLPVAGGIDSSWNAVANGPNALAVDSVGRVISAGFELKRFAADGSEDASWVPNPDAQITAIALDSSDSLYVGGYFANIGGHAMPYLARLHADGTADTTWSPAPNFAVQAIAPDNAGNVYVGGPFQTIGGASISNGVAKLSATTAQADTNWRLPQERCFDVALSLNAAQDRVFVANCGPALMRVGAASPARADGWGAVIDGDAGSNVRSVAVDSSGALHVGGTYTAINGAVRTSLALLPASAPALSLAERAWLSDFYSATNGPQWNDSTGWNGAPGSECQAVGVQCVNGHVVNLLLLGNNLDGTLPSLATLSSLHALDVRFNALHGTLPSLTAPTSLEVFAASGNSMSGTVPSLGSLVNLRELDLDANKFTGPIPSLVGLDRLETVTLSGNQLSGSIPPLNGLPKLTSFSATANQLDGQIPDLEDSPMQYFEVSFNQLSGSLPAMPGIWSFGARHNLLSGSLPDFSTMPFLSGIDVSENSLTGGLPDLSGNPRLFLLQVGSNQLSGALPAAPATLGPGGSILCPNRFLPVDDAGWDAATGVTPWWSACDSLFANGFD